MNKLRIGYFGDGKWAQNTFYKLIDDSTIDIGFICTRYDKEDMVLKDIALKYSIDYFRNKNINSKEFLEQVKKYDCDLFVSMSFNQIFKSEIIKLPRLKTINCHAGKLPFYRGRNVLNWVLINDENEFGITVHYVDEGIDTGDIIKQRVFPIDNEDDYSTLLDKAYLQCPNVLCEAIKLIQSNNVNAIKQADIHPVGFYCGMRKEGDEVIDWNQNSREIFNLIRAICRPGPMSRSTLNDKEIKINKARTIINAPLYKGIVGQVVGKTDNGFIVKTKDTTLEIVEYNYDGNIRIGDRLK